jgi:hypothetical protein
MKEKKEIAAVELKEAYELLRARYKLPEFKFLVENFEIGNIDENEKDILLKAIRKHITEKLFFTLRTLEMLINGQSAPMFMLKVMKSFNEHEKDTIKNLYQKMSKYELEAFGLEIIYDEKKEAEFISEVVADWKFFAEDLNKIFIAMKANYGRDSGKSRGSYLG